jgi:hypothetical protein
MNKIILFVCTCTFVFFSLILVNYGKIPSLRDHIRRNQYNIFPAGKLIQYDKNKYIDEDEIIWVKRDFLYSVFHNPLKYYVFESYDPETQYSFEVKAVKDEFDKGIQIFRFGSFNFYSSINHPVSHFFADVLPIFIYLAPKI